MKTDDSNLGSAAPTQRGRITDFLFVGVGIVPMALMLAGQPALALLLLIPLLLAACLCGAWEQVESTPRAQARGAAEAGVERTRAAASASLRDQLKR